MKVPLAAAVLAAAICLLLGMYWRRQANEPPADPYGEDEYQTWLTLWEASCE